MLSVMILSLLVVVCLLVVTLVLLQTEEGDGLGGMFSGGSRSAFGSRSASVLTKTSYVMVGLFFGLTFFLALLNRAPDDTGLQKAAQQKQAETAVEWWKHPPKEGAGAPTSPDSTGPAAGNSSGSGVAVPPSPEVRE